MTIGCAQRLREGTRVLHGQAERAGVMPALLRGELPLAGFCTLQRNLQPLYVALEAALQRHAGGAGDDAGVAAALAPLADRQLARSERLADDLAALHGADWAQALPLLPATTGYLQRLAALDARAPLLLAAHAYVRYLGDLAGGQVVARRVTDAYGLSGGAGTRFYDFGSAATAAALGGQVRAALDALPLDGPGADALVAEAQWAFGQHVALFEQLAEPAAAPVA